MTVPAKSRIRPHLAGTSFATSVPSATGAPGVAEKDIVSITPVSAVMHTIQMRELVTHAEALSTGANDLKIGIRESHAAAIANELNLRVQQQVKESPQVMLEVLGDFGFSWRDVARLLGVTVPAVQKWRSGAKMTGENRRKLATLVSGIDVAASQYTVRNIGSWFETPLADDVPVTPIDIWASGEYILALRYASGKLTAEETLDIFEPEWRTKWESEFEAVMADDGHISLVMKK